MKKDSYHYEKLAEQLEHMDKKSMDKLKQNLRDSYIQLKDLSNRCLIDLSNVEKNDKRVFYFKPESVMLEDPEKQKLYRENVIKRISQPPQIKKTPVLAEELKDEMVNVMQDLTEPDVTSEYLDRIGHHGTFTYGRLQYELENSIKRYERLSQDDDYGSIRDGERQRPRTRGSNEEISSSMYNENPRKDPLSCIRMDDFEIYLRQQTYEVKLFRTIEKFCARIKWIPVAKKYDMFKESHVFLKLEQEKLFNESANFEKRVRTRFDNSIMRKSDDLIVQMEEILQLHYQTNNYASNQFKTKAPIHISNVMELQLRILEKAADFKIFGDIELDEGHSFTYQVNIFFTTYFQRQIIKSQFSLYDSTVRDMKDAYESNEAFDDDVGDINEIQRRNLKTLMLIDFQMVDYCNSNQDQGNLFLLKKGKKINEQIPELKKNFQDIIVVRLKKSYWLKEVMLKPRVDQNLRQQNAFFSFEYTPDLILQDILDFIDINDIATINTIYSDLTTIYSQMSQNQKNMINQIETIIQQSLVTDQQAKQILEHFRDALKLHINENEHLNRDDLDEPTDLATQGDIPPALGNHKKMLMSRNSILRILPKHYIQSLYTLRHMKMRDNKTKLLYTLNFFRAVQKRLALDLREFVGREIVSENVESSAPQEANYTGKSAQIISGNINFSFKKEEDPNEKFVIGKDVKDNMADLENEDEEEQKTQQYDRTNLLDLKKWKYNSQFHNSMLSTCPIIPQFHSAHGEPLQDKFHQQDFTDSKSTTKTHITKKSSSFLTRMDAFQVNEETREIFVVDDFGMHLMYDCALDDMLNLDKEILKIGTYFIRKSEGSFDFKNYKFPLVERFQLLEELLECEFDFHFLKAKLVMVYLEAYEHICDPLEQQRMMQIITDLMSARPRIDYSITSSEYFLESYRSEMVCWETHYRLIKEIVDYQMKAEKKENQNIRDYLEMTYKIANSYVNKQWSDANQEDLKKEVKTRQVIQGGMRFNDLQEIQEQLKEEEKPSDQATTKANPSSPQRDSNVDKFAEILGLKGVSMETMLKTHQRTDEVTEEIMNQDANFIKTQEGYPIFIRESNDSLSKVKFTNYSNEIGVLDFYESLTVIPKANAAINLIFNEVVENTMPANQLQLIALNTIYLEKCYVEFKKCVAYSQDELIEYKGSQYIENDLIMASPDKLMFLIKDMVAHLSRTYKKSLNPFFVSKLDFYTVHNFQFQDMMKEQMQTQLRLDVNFTRNFIETQLQAKGGQARFFPKLREDDRKVTVPPMLLVFCNLVEVIRLREQMIVNVSESQVLTDVYTTLREQVNRSNYKLLFQNPLVFETFTVSKEQINFVEDGSLTDVDIDLAVNEYDNSLRSNLNFMNAESVQCLVLDGGVSELRGAVHYQVLQKQLLIVAVKTNLKMMDSHLRAIAELELFHQHRIKVDNSIIDYKALHRINGNINEDSITQARYRIMSSMTYEFGDSFMQILDIKQQARAVVERKFKQIYNQLSSLKEQFNEINTQVIQLPGYSIARLMRDYKISLLHSFCTQVTKQNMIEATRLELMLSTWETKKMMNLFPKEIGLFKLQNNEVKEVYFQNQYYDKGSDFEEMAYFSNQDTCEISNLLTIPSYKTILEMQAYTNDEKNQYEANCFDSTKQLEFDLDVFRKNQIEKVNLKQKQRHTCISLCKQQVKDSILITDSLAIGRLNNFQKGIMHLLEMSFFISKLSMHPLECLQMENAANLMLPFWQQQDTLLEDQLLTEVEDEGLGEKIMRKLIIEKKQKQSLNDEMEQLGKNIRGVFLRMLSDIVTSTLPEALDYLTKYNQQLHYKVMAGLLNVLDSFYLKSKSPKTLDNLHWCLREMTNIELIAPVFSNGTVIHYRNVDPYQRQLSFSLKQDYEVFQKTVKGLKNENEMISGEFLLLEQIFGNYMGKKEKANYTGQQYTRQYSYLNVIQQLIILISQFQSMILGLEREEITYLSTVYTSIDQTLKELLELDKIINDASLYSLQKKNLYAQDMIKSKGLYFGLIILTSKSTISIYHQAFQSQLRLYKNEVNWKIENEFQKKLNKYQNKAVQDTAMLSNSKQKQGGGGGTGSSHINDERVVRASVIQLDYNIQQSVALQQYRTVQRDLQIQQIRSTNLLQKSIIKMSQREIERRLLRIALDAISGQISGISKALEMSSKNIENSGQVAFSGTVQNFAPTFFDHINKNSHLEVVNRVSQMQVLLTRIRNRGMDIETLTSGPGIVFTYKDLNECLQQFCNDAISFSEKELKTRTSGFQQIINHQRHMIYIKDRRVDALKSKLKMMYENITRIVNSRIYEKGNTLIFELDRALREVKFYKDHIYIFEKEMKEFVREEFRLMLQRKDMQIDLQKKQMKDVGNQLVSEVKAHVLNEQKRIKKQIKQTARKMRDLDSFKQPVNNNNIRHRATLYNSSQTRMDLSNNNNNSYNHQPTSQSQFNQSRAAGTPQPLDNIQVRAEEWIISPQEATRDMIAMQQLLFKQRTFWMLKFQSQQKHYEDAITILKTKLTSNTALWEQLQESDKRTKILQQELTFTQKSLSQCEKIIEKLKEELKQSEQERVRLFQYKQNKAQRLEELEYQVKKIDISEHINITKVIDLLSAKDKELLALKRSEKTFEERLEKVQGVIEKEKHKWSRKYEKEVELKSQVIGKMAMLKDELKGFEGGNKGNDVGMNNEVWKAKTKEMLEICQGLADENQILMSRLRAAESLNQMPLPDQSTQQARTRNQKFQDQSSVESGAQNLFTSDNTNKLLPNIKPQLDKSHQQLNSSAIGAKRVSDHSPQHHLSSDYSQYPHHSQSHLHQISTDLQNFPISTSSNNTQSYNSFLMMPLKPIKPIETYHSTSQQQQQQQPLASSQINQQQPHSSLSATKTQLKNIQYYKSKMVAQQQQQQRNNLNPNLSTYSYSGMSVYENNSSNLMMVMGASSQQQQQHHSSERTHQQQYQSLHPQQQQLMMVKGLREQSVQNRTERKRHLLNTANNNNANNADISTTNITNKSIYYDDFSIGKKNGATNNNRKQN